MFRRSALYVIAAAGKTRIIKERRNAMPVLNYKRSRAKETQVKHLLEKDGYYAVRSAGSKGIADVVGLKLTNECTYPNHFFVKFIQIKVSENLKKGKIIDKFVETKWGPINLEVWKFPVYSKKWQKKYSKKAKKLKKKNASSTISRGGW